MRFKIIKSGNDPFFVPGGIAKYNQLVECPDCSKQFWQKVESGCFGISELPFQCPVCSFPYRDIEQKNLIKNLSKKLKKQRVKIKNIKKQIKKLKEIDLKISKSIKRNILNEIIDEKKKIDKINNIVEDKKGNEIKTKNNGGVSSLIY